MSKLLTMVLAVLLLTGCSTTIKSPVTQFEYTGYIRQEGVGVSVKPPGWQWGVDLYKCLTNGGGE